MSPIAWDHLQGDDDVMTIEVENLRKTIQGKNHYKDTLSNEAFTMISEIITFTGKGRACVQWNFSLDTAGFGHMSKSGHVSVI